MKGNRLSILHKYIFTENFTLKILQKRTTKIRAQQKPFKMLSLSKRYSLNTRLLISTLLISTLSTSKLSIQTRHIVLNTQQLFEQVERPASAKVTKLWDKVATANHFWFRRCSLTVTRLTERAPNGFKYLQIRNLEIRSLEFVTSCWEAGRRFNREANSRRSVVDL